MALRTAAPPPRAHPARSASLGEHRLLPWLAGGLALIALAAGVLAPVKRAATKPGETVRAMSGVTLTLPAGWSRTPAPQAVPGLALRDAVAWAPAGHAAQASLVIGRAAAPAPTLLPDAFVDRPGVRLTPAHGIAVGSADALLYQGIAVQGAARHLDLYAAPSGDAVYVAACRAATKPDEAYLAACRIAVQSLILPTVQTAQVSALDPAYGRAVGVAMTRLRAERTRTRRLLARAGSGSAQATAALALTSAYRHAARDVGSGARRLVANGAPRPAAGTSGSGLAGALAAAAGAYRGLASASAHRRSADFRAARARILETEQVVDRQLRALTALGYRP